MAFHVANSNFRNDYQSCSNVRPSGTTSTSQLQHCIISSGSYALDVKQSLANFCDELDRLQWVDGLAMPVLDVETASKLLESLDWIELFVQARLAATAEHETEADEQITANQAWIHSQKDKCVLDGGQQQQQQHERYTIFIVTSTPCFWFHYIEEPGSAATQDSIEQRGIGISQRQRRLS